MPECLSDESIEELMKCLLLWCGPHLVPNDSVPCVPIDHAGQNFCSSARQHNSDSSSLYDIAGGIVSSIFAALSVSISLPAGTRLARIKCHNISVSTSDSVMRACTKIDHYPSDQFTSAVSS